MDINMQEPLPTGASLYFHLCFWCLLASLISVANGGHQICLKGSVWFPLPWYAGQSCDTEHKQRWCMYMLVVRQHQLHCWGIRDHSQNTGSFRNPVLFWVTIKQWKSRFSLSREITILTILSLLRIFDTVTLFALRNGFMVAQLIFKRMIQ